MKFLSGCFNKILKALFCVLLGVVLTLGGIVGAGYYILMTDGMMGTMADKANESGITTLEFSDEVRDMSVLNWAKGFGDIVSNLSVENGPTIGEFEKYLGTDIISLTISEFLKLDQSVITSACLVGDENGLAAVVVDKMTMNKVVEMVGDDNFMPDMPLFDEEGEFMNSPIKTAFSTITDHTIGDFIKTDENSAKVMKTISGLKISEINDKLPTLPIGDFIDQGEDTHPVIIAISPLSISDLGTSRLTETINGMQLSDILTDMNETDTNKVLYSLKDLTIGDLSGTKADKLIKSMFLCEIMTINESSNQALKSLKYACIESQYATLSSPTIDGQYAYTDGSSYVSLKSNIDGSRYVLFYPETISYSTEKESGVVVTSNGFYKTKYTINVPAELVGDAQDTVELADVIFTIDKDEENNRITTEDGEVQLSAYLYLSDKDFTLSEDENTMTVNNRYHLLYDEDGDFAFVNGYFDAEAKGALLLPSACVGPGSDDDIVCARSEYLIAGEDRFYDNKPLKTEERLTETTLSQLGATVNIPVYRNYPLEGINETMNELTLEGVIVIDESSPKLLKSMRDTKITEMGTRIDAMTLGEMVDTSSSKLLQSLSDTTLNGLGNKVNTLFIDEIITLDTNSSQMIKSLRYATLESQIVYLPLSGLHSSDTVSAINAAQYQALETETYSAYKKADSTIVNRYYYHVTSGAIDEAYVLYYNENDEVKTEGANTAFYEVKLYEQKTYSFVDLTTLTPSDDIDNSVGDNAAILAAEKQGLTYYYALDGSNAIVTAYIVVMEDGAPVTDPASTPILTKVYTVTERYNRPMVGLSDKTNELTLGDVFSSDNLERGVLSLIDPQTKLNNISNEVATAVQNSSVAVLSDTGVIDSTTFGGSDFTSLSKERKCFIYNSTMTDMLNGMIGFVAHPLSGDPMNPIDYSKVSPHHTDVSGTTFASLSAFISAYSMYDELTFTDGDVVVTIDPDLDGDWARDVNNDNVIDYYAIPLFSIKGTNKVSFEDETNAPTTVYAAIYGTSGYGKHQVGYYYDESTGGSIQIESANPKIVVVS